MHNAASIPLHSQVLLGAASREKVFPNALRQRTYVVKILITLTDLPQGYTHTELHQLAPFPRTRNVFSDCVSVSAPLVEDDALKR